MSFDELIYSAQIVAQIVSIEVAAAGSWDQVYGRLPAWRGELVGRGPKSLRVGVYELLPVTPPPCNCVLWIS